jgi:hypothetical protein
LERLGARAVGAFGLLDDLSAWRAAERIADRHGANGNGDGDNSARRGGVVWRGGGAPSCGRPSGSGRGGLEGELSLVGDAVIAE